MQYQINVGLEVPNQTSDISDLLERADRASVLLNQRFVNVLTTVKESSTELTLVAQFDDVLGCVEQAAREISDLLAQDCVAVFNPVAGTGKLIGERAESWGAFNSKFFLKY